MTIGSIAVEDIDFSDEEEDEGEESATMEALIRFPDGSRLFVNLTVDESEGFPSPRKYSFHYMTADNTTIFRYDNRDYHPGLPHEPHHKHEGESGRIIGCPQPSVSAIRDEIEAYLKGLN